MLGIGIIGGGRVCRAHAVAAQALASTRLVAIAEVDEERRAKAAAEYGCRGYPDYDTLLQDPEVEAVVIGLPHFLHLPAAVASLGAGRHVLIEKPMAMSVEECDAILDAARRAGATLMIGHSQHFFPANVEARRLVQEGVIGVPVMACDTWNKPFWEGVRPPWFLDDSKGGGMWSMNGSHMIDRLKFYLDSEVVSVKARVGNPIHGVSTDMGLAFLQFKNGVAAVLHHVGYQDGVHRFEAELTGTRAQLRISGDRGGSNPLLISRNGLWEEHPVVAPTLDLKAGAAAGGPFIAQMEEFAAAIREGRPPSIPGEWGREVVRVLDACVESSRTGREVCLA
ncbi:MAG: Gfo/Idh/MocA family oxidoreductase [Armatimonadetes bacterium]|nr:Gfo/Idh/MocA family oxidoreductase [Armatimonadota bacterium]